MSPYGPSTEPSAGSKLNDAGDVAAGVERQPLDPVLRVVGEEVAALVDARELRPVVDEAAGDRGVAAVVRVGVDRARAGRLAHVPFDSSASRSSRPRAPTSISSFAVE